MAKFDGRTMPTPIADALTGNGAAGFTRTDKLELVLLGASNFVSEDTYYESGSARDSRFVDLVRSVAVSDPKWAAEFVRWLRQDANMRSAAVVAAAEYVVAGAPGGRAVVDSALQRPDEPGEMLAYWRSTYGRKSIPKPIKRGVADAARRLYTERNVLRYDGQSKNWRFGDVIELTHPRPSDPRQSDLFRFAIERRQGRDTEPAESLGVLCADAWLQSVPESERRSVLGGAIEAGWSWERVAGWLPGGMDAQAWEALIPNMGLMALARNLRNFDAAGISADAAAVVEARLRDPEEVRRSRQLPFRFLSAWKNVSSLRWGPALEDALNHSLDNVPSLPGRTLVLLDVSGSMMSYVGSGGRGTGSSPLRWETAAVFGLAFASRAESADVFTFNSHPTALTFRSGDSILRSVTEMGRRVGGCTNTLGSLLSAYSGHDRVVIVTDEQTGPSSYYMGGRNAWPEAHRSIRVPVITFNVAGYRVGHTPVHDNWITIGGLNDAAFGLVAAVGSDRSWHSVVT